MLIWILALVLFGCLGFVGFTLGVIRTAFTFIGLLVSAVLAWPLGHLVNPILGMTGLKNPIMIWFLGPFVVFWLILIVFKVSGYFVHRKVDVWYKYKAGDLKMGLWTRLNARLGLCMGLANAAVYLVLICCIIYVFSYATKEVADGPEVSWSVKLLNSAGQAVQDTGMSKVAAALSPIPDKYYQTVDLIGLIYHNDLLEGRVARYPAFLDMGELPEFQAIAKDKQFTEMRQRQAPISEILNQPDAQAIINNTDLLSNIWSVVSTNLSDFKQYLTNGVSAKFDEPILGRWHFNVGRAVYIFKQMKPNVGSIEMARTRHIMNLLFDKTTLVATPEHKLYLKNLAKLNPPKKPNTPPSAADLTYQNINGLWDGAGGKYDFSLQDQKRKLSASIDGDRMMVTGEAFPVVFDRDY